MCIVMLVTYTESTADMLAVGEMIDKDLSPERPRARPGHRRPLGLLAGFMNSFPDTAYAENVGLVSMTKRQEPVGRHGLRRRACSSWA